MNNKTFVSVALLLLVIAAGIFWYSNQKTGQKQEATASTGMGSYAYTCENGSQFTMSPSEDTTSVRVSAGSQGMFTGEATLERMGEGPHFEGTAMGSPVVFIGAGEEVDFSVGSDSTVCNPVPNSEMAPWNWGDTGEGGSVKPDVRLVAGESAMGKWQDTTDAKFVREFKDFKEGSLSGTVVDSYDGKVVSNGTYVTFTQENPLQVAFPIDPGTVYMQLTMTGSQAEKLNFKVVKLTPEEMQLVYLDRGGTLSFKLIK